MPFPYTENLKINLCHWHVAKVEGAVVIDQVKDSELCYVYSS